MCQISIAVDIGGQVAYAGDLAEVTESEAADLVLTGRAELLPN